MKKERFIPGIYNYCDYWCERCAFTRRCRNFAMGREIERTARGEAPVEDAVNAAFWKGLADKLHETAAFGRREEWAQDDGSDADDTPDPEWEARKNARHQAVREHSLSRLAKQYMTQVDAWLKTADADLKAVAQELLQTAESRFTTEDTEETALQIGEMIEVVSWYHTLIPPKLGRALGGLLERDDGEGEFAAVLAESRQSDASGSGKVALIAIERSIAAWLRLREILPNQEDSILAMLSVLSRLRQGIHTALPGARTFRRPGFDGEPEPDADELQTP